MVRVAFIVATLALAAGCKGQLNAAYCADHRDDPDCLNGGLVLLDAPAPECTVSADCTPDKGGSVCDTQTQQCVECIDGTDELACTGQTPACGADQKCHGCVVDTDCPSAVCLATQSCALESEVLYAAPTGAGDVCTRSSPCTFSGAVARLASDRHIIKLTTFSGFDYAEDPIVISSPYGVQILGTGTTFTPTTGVAIFATGASLEIVGLTINATAGPGVRCASTTGGTLVLRQMRIAGSDTYGVSSAGCDVTIERTRLSTNRSGAIGITDGKVEIRNNLLDGNGNTNLETGAVFLRNVTGRMVFNTLVNTISRSGGQRIGGIDCTDGGGFVIAQNILASWGAAPNSIVGCSPRDNYETQTITDVKFASATDYHLTAQSPSPDVRDDTSVLVDMDCRLDATNRIDDIDGQSRASNPCDRGADEYRP